MRTVKEDLKYLVVVLAILAVVALMTACSLPTGPEGAPGTTGPSGPAGSPGAPGYDGRDGANGQDGRDAVIEVVDPCGPQANGLDEILLRLADGRVFAYLENGSRHYLSLLPAGNYVTTDGTNCYFSVTPSGTVQ